MKTHDIIILNEDTDLERLLVNSYISNSKGILCRDRDGLESIYDPENPIVEIALKNGDLVRSDN